MIIEDAPKELLNMYDAWKSERNKWMRYGQQCEEMVNNDVDGTHTMYTNQQLETIKKDMSNIPATVNYLYPTFEQKLALLIANKTMFKTVSIDKRGTDVAIMMEKFIKHILYKSQAFLALKNYLKSYLATGHGYMMIVPQTKYQNGEFGIAIKNIVKENVILDCNSQEENYSDAEGFFIEKEISENQLLAEYGSYLQNCTNFDGSPIDIKSIGSLFSNSVDDKVRLKNVSMQKTFTIKEYYDKVFTTLYYVQDKTTGNIIKLFAENLEDVDQVILQDAVNKEEGLFVRKIVIIGNKVIGHYTMALTEFPLKISYFEWSGKPYRSYGMVHFVQGLQEAFNKTIQIMLVNGMLQNNAGYKAAKGNIPDEDRQKWEDSANNPHVIKEFVPVELNGQVFIPEREQIQGISQFYPMLLEMFKNGIEYVTGINPMLQGNPSSGVEVFSTVQQYTNAAMQRIILSSQSINVSMEQIGMTVIEYLAWILEPDKYVYFFDDKDNMNQMELTKEFISNLKLNRYMLLSVPDTLTPTQKMATATELYKIAQTTTDPGTRDVYVQAAIGMQDVKELKDLNERIDVVKQLQGQVQQMQEGMKRMEELNKSMENKVITAEVQTKIYQKLFNSAEAIAAAEGEIKAKNDIATKMVNKDINDIINPKE